MSLSRQQRRAAERRARKEERKLAQLGAITETSKQEMAAEPSTARLEANRANAQFSTGPRTPEGKAISSRNSFKHGLYSKQLVIPGEDPAELDALKADLIAEHQPGNLTEEILVNEMAEHYWRLKRFRHLETMLMEEDSVLIAKLTAVQRFMNSAERGFHKLSGLCASFKKPVASFPQFASPPALTQKMGSFHTQRNRTATMRERSAPKARHTHQPNTTATVTERPFRSARLMEPTPSVHTRTPTHSSVIRTSVQPTIC